MIESVLRRSWNCYEIYSQTILSDQTLSSRHRRGKTFYCDRQHISLAIMSATAKLLAKSFAATLVVGSVAVAAMADIKHLRSDAVHILGLSSPGSRWKLAAIVLAILNLKNLPFVWHVC